MRKGASLCLMQQIETLAVGESAVKDVLRVESVARHSDASPTQHRS